VIKKLTNIALVLVFAVGQVQYAYTIYFCNMKKIPVSHSQTSCEACIPSSSTAAGDMDMTDSCVSQKDLASASYQSPIVEKLASSSCCSLKLISKSVVDNFTDFQNHITTYLPTNIFTVSCLSPATTLLVSSVQSIQASPPDIITFQSNFRI
jgi:hypothetical protein